MWNSADNCIGRIDLSGRWEIVLNDGRGCEGTLPGTLDENCIGGQDRVARPWHPDVAESKKRQEMMQQNGVIVSRLTRRHTCEGAARFVRKLRAEECPPAEKRVFLVAERARALSLAVDGRNVPKRKGSLSTPWVFEVTGLLHPDVCLELVSDNSYPGMPAQEILASSAATDETQTNWNGIVGGLYLEIREKCFFSALRVYPSPDGRITVAGELDGVPGEAEKPLSLMPGDLDRRPEKVDVGVHGEAEKPLSLTPGDRDRCPEQRGVGAHGEAEKPLSLTPGDPEKRSERGTDGGAGQEAAMPALRLRFSGSCLAAEVSCLLSECRTAQLSTAIMHSGMQTEALAESDPRPVPGAGDQQQRGLSFWRIKIPLTEEAGTCLWDEGEGRLQELHAELLCDDRVLCEETVRFGVRTFGSDREGRLVLNGRRIFLRGETNCAVFPETGHPPMNAEDWLEIMRRYASYGVNCVRFHSWCPPEAAFQAADVLGMMVQPELSHWNPRCAMQTEEARKYYGEELREILSEYANHPSFVMLTLGNELQADEAGRKELQRLTALAAELDPTRLYAWGSNNFYGEREAGEAGDFYTSASCHGKRLRACGNRGPINTEYPGTERNYDDAMAAIRREYDGPVFGFEVGQYQVLPDFDELEEFRGVTRPDNLTVVRERACRSGISPEEWKRQVEATGELSLICYREEVESAMRTEEMSGLSLLGLQDFPGQGTALIGMMNSHLQPKPFAFARPERFREFFAPQRILVLMPRYTWARGEVIRGEIRIANYGKETLAGRIRCALVAPSASHSEKEESGSGVNNRTGNDRITQAGDAWKEADCTGHEMCDGVEDNLVSKYSIIFNDNTNTKGGLQEIPPGTTLSVGELCIPLDDAVRAVRLDLRIALEDGTGEERLSSVYPVWVYPDAVKPVCPASVYETEVWDEQAKNVLQKGGRVYLTQPSTAEALPHSIQAQFATDFWSVGTFPEQEGAMGQLIDNTHPIFADFPTEFHTNWQWWPMASQRAIVLPRRLKCIVAVMDSYATLRPMAQLFEARCRGGRILVSSLGLQNLQQYPEARALLKSIYRYLASEVFLPEEELTQEELDVLLGRDGRGLLTPTS